MHVAKLRFTKNGTWAIVVPPWTSCRACQPPRPSGTVIFVFSVPSAAAVAVPSGMAENAQQVPLQLTRLPTTVAHCRVTGALGVSPLPETSTFVRIWPLVTLNDAVAVVVPAVDFDSVEGRRRGHRGRHVHRPVDARDRPARVLGDGEDELPLIAEGSGDCGECSCSRT